MSAAFISISVNGEPAPQGSKRHVGNGRLIEASRKVKPWRLAVYRAAREALDRQRWVPGDKPVGVEVHFYLPRPASAKNRHYPSVRPDLDKLVRSTLDGLDAAGVFHDDSRVCELTAFKVYASDARGPGAYIEVWEK